MRKSLKFEIIRGAAAILVALAVAMVFIFIISDVPFQALYNLIVAPFTRMRYIWIILERMIPIIFTGLATCVMFNANQFNLAGEGAVFFQVLRHEGGRHGRHVPGRRRHARRHGRRG